MAGSALAGIPAFDPIAAVTPFTTRDNQSYLSILEDLRVTLVGLITDYNGTVAQTAAERETLRVGVNTAIAAANTAIEEAAASAAAAELSASLVNAPADDVMGLLLRNTGSDAHAAVADVFALLFPDAIDARVKGTDPDVYASRYLPGAASDLAALQAARDAAVARKGRLVIDDIGRDWTISDSLLFQNLANFSMHMEGRIARANGSARSALIYFLNCTGLRVGTLRTNGNAANNADPAASGGAIVDEAKHDVRVEGGDGARIHLISSLNPAGDALYMTGANTNTWIGHVRSRSDAATGRNTLSIVQGDKIIVESVMCDGTGATTMPGGFDIEPNNGQTVSNVTLGKALVRTKGTSGFNVFGVYTAAGVRQIQTVNVGEVTVVKDAGASANGCDCAIRGVDYLAIGSLTIRQDASNGQQAISVDDATNVSIMNLQVPRSSKAFAIGFNTMVDGLYLRGAYNASASHCLAIYNLNNASIDMRLRCLAAGGLLVVKNGVGTSAGVRFRGDWRKDGTAGTGVMQLNAAVTDWVMDQVNAAGWTANRLVASAPTLGGLKRVNCQGINTGTAAPSTIADWWNTGDIVWNDAPAAGGPPAWVCTAGGNYGTWKAFANIAP